MNIKYIYKLKIHSNTSDIRNLKQSLENWPEYFGEMIGINFWNHWNEI
jgi:hypothetical protein